MQQKCHCWKQEMGEEGGRLTGPSEASYQLRFLPLGAWRRRGHGISAARVLGQHPECRADWALVDRGVGLERGPDDRQQSAEGPAEATCGHGTHPARRYQARCCVPGAPWLPEWPPSRLGYWDGLPGLICRPCRIGAVL